MGIYKEDIVDIELETGTIHRSFLNHAIGLGDAKGNRFGVRLFRNGVAENVGSATVTGLFMSPDGNNYTISGSGSSSQYHWINGNIAGVILPSSFYAVEGQFTLAIKLSLSGVVTTMRIVDGVVSNTGASGAVVPSSSVPTSDQIIAAYNNAIAVVDNSVRFDTAQSITNAQRQTARTNIKAASITMFAPEFSADSSTSYDQGDYVIYDQNLWRCKKATTGGTWTGTTDWVKVAAGAEIDNVLKQTAAQFDISATYSAGDYAIYQAELYRFNVAHTGSWAAADVTKVKMANELRDKISDINIVLFDQMLEKHRSINRYVLTYGVETGYVVNGSGGTTAATSGRTTSYIPVSPNTEYNLKNYDEAYSGGTWYSSCEFYDNDKNYVSGRTYYAGNVITGDSVYYMRFSNYVVSTIGSRWEKGIMIVEASKDQNTYVEGYNDYYVSKKVYAYNNEVAIELFGGRANDPDFDNTPALKRLLEYYGSTFSEFNGCTILFETGNYYFKTAITINFTIQNLTIKGKGLHAYDVTTTHGTALIYSGTNEFINISSFNNLIIQDISIWGNDTNNGIFIGSDFNNVASNATIERVGIQHFAGGLRIGSAGYVRIKDCSFSGAQNGEYCLNLRASRTAPCEYIWVERSSFEGLNAQGGSAIVINGGNFVWIDKCDICNWKTQDPAVYVNAVTSYVQRLQILRNSFYNNNGNIKMYCGFDTNYTQIKDNYIIFLSNNEYTYFVNINGGDRYRALSTKIENNVITRSGNLTHGYILDACFRTTINDRGQGIPFEVTSNTLNWSFKHELIKTNYVKSFDVDANESTYTVVLNASSPLSFTPYVIVSINGLSNDMFTTTVNNTYGGNLEVVITLTEAVTVDSLVANITVCDYGVIE